MEVMSERISIGNYKGFIVTNRVEFFLFFPLNRYVFNISNKAYNILTKKNNDNYEKLQNRILEKLSFTKEQEIETVPAVDRENNVLGLALTTQCNLRCLYCHANAGKSDQFISDQLIIDAINFVFKRCKDNKKAFYLVFTGSGEPTVNWNGLKKAVEYSQSLCKQENLPLIISMATNGLYDESIRKYIKNNFSRITLSMDGPKNIHDQNRLQSSGEGSFDRVYETAKYFYNNKFPFRFRATISKQSSIYMLNIYEFFQEEFPGVSIAFEPLNPIGRGRTSICLPPSQEEFANGYLSIIDKYGPSKIKYSAISTPTTLRDRFCSPVARPNLNISVDGRVHSCSRSGIANKFYFGKYNNENGDIVLDQDTSDVLSKINVDNFPECDVCFARYNCAGDCHDLREVGFSRCYINKAILFKLLQHELAKGGGIRE